MAAGRYLELFAGHVDQASLQDDAAAVLTAIGQLGVAQVLISATIPAVLARQMAPHPIAGHFDQVLGIADAFTPSKADVISAWLRSSGHDPRRVLMVGDTNHDEEIAEDLGLGFVRFALGCTRTPTASHEPPYLERHLQTSSRDVMVRIETAPDDWRDVAPNDEDIRAAGERDRNQ